MSQGAVGRIRAWALVPDLFLRAKVETLAAHANVDVRFFAAPSELLQALAGAARDGGAPALLLADLSDTDGRGMTLLEGLARTAGPPVLGFYSHVENATRQRALDLGARRIVPRSAFFMRFAELVAETIR